MTAEIAVLNKSAVALASDSAVTISAGPKEEKIYFTADKLFELSRRNPIGIMIYNGMQFMQAPLHMLIDNYRQNCQSFDHVQDAAVDFLNYLNRWGQSAPDEVMEQVVESVLLPVADRIVERITTKVAALVRKGPNEGLGDKLNEAVDDVLGTFERFYETSSAADFIGAKPRITKARDTLIRKIVSSVGPPEGEQHERLVGILKQALVKLPLSDSKTGIVVAGFGTKDLFPTLVSYEIDGLLFGRLKYRRTNYVDIDRRTDRARVLPFAQKEMVERFLYGIDADIERKIGQFAKETVSEITKEVFEYLDMTDDDKAKLLEKAQAAEQAFLQGLKGTAFEQIRSESRAAVEGMVEFMPKPELATMAEALVNLTSIKRRVSRGMETVGGPIDVAVISRSEGFVWVKRKHYFSPELNPRYLARVQNLPITVEEANDGKAAHA